MSSLARRSTCGLAVVGLSVSLAAVSLAAAQTGPSKEADRGQEAEYRLRPGDVVQVFVWKEPDLTRDVTVRFDGMITLPLVGDVEASGHTPNQLAGDLAKALGRFVELPRVTVGVLQANSARFYVVGQVGKSGEFPLSGRTTVLQALALAGGFKEFAKTDGIVIVRRDQRVVPVNYKRIADGSDVSQNVLLGPGDTIVVP